jgi:uncharacterized protein (TIGR02246 family)
MLRPVFLSLMLSAVAMPAMAQNIKQDIEQLRAAYEACVNKHDAACVASMYAKDGVQINPDGSAVAPDGIKARYEGGFKTGHDSVVIKTTNLTPINNDSAIGDGIAIATFKTDQGVVVINLLWGNYFVRENGQMKVRM